MEKVALIVAGGKGSRMGAEIPKQFLNLAGLPILVHTIRAFWEYDPTMALCLVLPKEEFARWEEIASTHFLPDEMALLLLAEGGSQRTLSVYQGLRQLEGHIANPAACWIAIHDGVRPFISPEILSSSFILARQHGASVTCVPATSSLRQQMGQGGSKAVDRRDFFRVQTPQCFRFDLILNAYSQRPHDNFTDDASLLEERGGKVVISEGSYSNIKITTQEDLLIAEQIFSSSSSSLRNQSAKDIRLILLDIDGTLTDGGVYYTEKGDVIKRFDVKDGMAIHRMITRHKMEFGFISSGATATLIENRAKKLGVQRWHSGKTPKIEKVTEWQAELGLSLSQIAYLGDDLNDMAVMQKVGLSACPADAVPEVRAIADVVLTRKGGQGCAREFFEKVLGYSLVD